MTPIDHFALLIFLLVFAHYLADFPLQGDFLSRAKNCTAPIPGVPWQWAMSAHVTIHAGFVFLITNRPDIAMAEALVHGIIDDQKCKGRITFSQDQALHILFKVIWAALVVWGPRP